MRYLASFLLFVLNILYCNAQTDSIKHQYVWYRMDLRQDLNKPFYAAERSLPSILIDAVKEGTIHAYPSEELIKPYTKDEFLNSIAKNIQNTEVLEPKCKDCSPQPHELMLFDPNDLYFVDIREHFLLNTQTKNARSSFFGEKGKNSAAVLALSIPQENSKDGIEYRLAFFDAKELSTALFSQSVWCYWLNPFNPLTRCSFELALAQRWYHAKCIGFYHPKRQNLVAVSSSTDMEDLYAALPEYTNLAQQIRYQIEYGEESLEAIENQSKSSSWDKGNDPMQELNLKEIARVCFEVNLESAANYSFLAKGRELPRLILEAAKQGICKMYKDQFLEKQIGPGADAITALLATGKQIQIKQSAGTVLSAELWDYDKVSVVHYIKPYVWSIDKAMLVENGFSHYSQKYNWPFYQKLNRLQTVIGLVVPPKYANGKAKVLGYVSLKEVVENVLQQNPEAYWTNPFNAIQKANMAIGLEKMLFDYTLYSYFAAPKFVEKRVLNPNDYQEFANIITQYSDKVKTPQTEHKLNNTEVAEVLNTYYAGRKSITAETFLSLSYKVDFTLKENASFQPLLIGSALEALANKYLHSSPFLNVEKKNNGLYTMQGMGEIAPTLFSTCYITLLATPSINDEIELSAHSLLLMNPSEPGKVLAKIDYQELLHCMLLKDSSMLNIAGTNISGVIALNRLFLNSQLVNASTLHPNSEDFIQHFSEKTIDSKVLAKLLTAHPMAEELAKQIPLKTQAPKKIDEKLLENASTIHQIRYDNSSTQNWLTTLWYRVSFDNEYNHKQLGAKKLFVDLIFDGILKGKIRAYTNEKMEERIGFDEMKSRLADLKKQIGLKYELEFVEDLVLSDQEVIRAYKAQRCAVCSQASQSLEPLSKGSLSIYAIDEKGEQFVASFSIEEIESQIFKSNEDALFINEEGIPLPIIEVLEKRMFQGSLVAYLDPISEKKIAVKSAADLLPLKTAFLQAELLFKDLVLEGKF